MNAKDILKKIICVIILCCSIPFITTACSKQKLNPIFDLNYTYTSNRERVGEVYQYYTLVTGSIKNNMKMPIYNIYVYYEIEHQTGELIYGETKVVGINGIQPGEEKTIRFRIEANTYTESVVRVVISNYSE